ncbi:MAG TPA: AAA family ATPase [Bryobacteraceae bacterium]|nr:AAA family ATPase [Bryobacteraceae bacterium]
MEAVLLIGVQGAGKTTFFEQRFAATHVHISRDVLGSLPRERAAVETCIGARKPFVIDNTNALASTRAAWIARAKAADYRIVGYFFNTEMRAAIARNNKRTNRKPVPVPGLLRTWKVMEPPSIREGFDELYTVTPKRELMFDVTPREAS